MRRLYLYAYAANNSTYRVFSLTWPTSMQIYWNKRKRLHEKRVELPQDWFGTPTWSPFLCFGTPIWPPWRHVKTLYRAFSLSWSASMLIFGTKESFYIRKEFKFGTPTWPPFNCFGISIWPPWRHVIGDIIVYKHCFLLFRFVRSETRETFVTRTNAQ